MMENTLTLNNDLKEQIEARLRTYEYSDLKIQALLTTYRDILLEWQQAYLVTGTHVSPDNMADDIVFAERL
ncbi:hypothetical protein [Levilactobacillus yiduensis]|uniref:hypothetical protein n=1 Tax=Levilactobacillus yiduensis TaxID=2953880 RepID=UPI000EF2E6CE|nr:hypothetical protein [Levilactobacillus yiduensis]AYM02678.1 hypothetical protein D8911_06575 [Levilactobacillus brevis]